MDEIEILWLLRDKGPHRGIDLIEDRSISLVELIMMAQGMKHKGWIDFRRNRDDPLLRILPLGEQVLAQVRNLS